MRVKQEWEWEASFEEWRACVGRCIGTHTSKGAIPCLRVRIYVNFASLSPACPPPEDKAACTEEGSTE